jgi:hypothetical protein
VGVGVSVCVSVCVCVCVCMGIGVGIVVMAMIIMAAVISVTIGGRRRVAVAVVGECWAGLAARCGGQTRTCGDPGLRAPSLLAPRAFPSSPRLPAARFAGTSDDARKTSAPVAH